jgi:hypothetical protein
MQGPTNICKKTRKIGAGQSSRGGGFSVSLNVWVATMSSRQKLGIAEI